MVGTTAKSSNVANNLDRNGARRRARARDRPSVPSLVRSLRAGETGGFSSSAGAIAWVVGFRISFILDNLRGYTRTACPIPAGAVAHASILEWHGNVVVPRSTC